jgi:hypothetical protein
MPRCMYLQKGRQSKRKNQHSKKENMKTSHVRFQYRTLATALLALASTMWLPNAVQAQRGEERIIHWQQVNPHQAATPSTPGDMPVKCCPKCKETQVAMVQPPTKAGAPAEAMAVQRHGCPGCHSAMTFEGSGRQGQETTTHACKFCATKAATCHSLGKVNKS